MSVLTTPIGGITPMAAMIVNGMPREDERDDRAGAEALLQAAAPLP